MKAVNNIIAAIEQGIITEGTKQRLSDLEREKKELSNTITAEEIQKPFLTKEQITELDAFCYKNDIRIGIIAVPKLFAQEICDKLVKNNVVAILNFAPINISAPSNVIIKQENLALSLAHLKNQI